MPLVQGAPVPAGAEVWRAANGAIFLVYPVPGSANGARMFWHVGTDAQAAALFGDDGWGDNLDRDDVSLDELHVATAGGMFVFGQADEIRNTSDDPFNAFLANFEREAQIRPWLKDPEVLALTAAAIVEGREVTQAEVQTTNWWRSANDGQRAWAQLSASNPAQARQQMDDNRRTVAEAIRQAGVDNLPGHVAELVADKLTRGEWSESFVQEQVRKLSDPAAPGALAAEIQDAIKGVSLDTTRDRVERVRGLFREYLGPLYGDPGEEQLNSWAGRLRNDPDGETHLLDHLRGTLKSVFGERVTDPALTYEDIAQPARVHFQNVWNETPDERDAFFVNIARQTDHSQAEAMLRSEGRKRGVEKVVNDLTEGLVQLFGQPLSQI